MEKKNRLEKLMDATRDWEEENKGRRCVFSVLSDEDEKQSICAVIGTGKQLTHALVNEMLCDKDVECIVLAAVEIYKEKRKEMEKEATKEQPKTKTPKRMLS